MGRLKIEWIYIKSLFSRALKTYHEYLCNRGEPDLWKITLSLEDKGTSILMRSEGLPGDIPSYLALSYHQ